MARERVSNLFLDGALGVRGKNKKESPQ